MSGADNIDVRIEERELYLDRVNTHVVTFTGMGTGFAFVMPRDVWDAKGRPARVKISGQVIL